MEDQVKSPVTSQTALWLLLTMTINTMAQSLSLTQSHIFYLHSSPLYSLTLTLWTYLRILISSLTLPTSFSQALKIALRTQADTHHGDKPTPLEREGHTALPSSNEKESPNPKTWPRWLFFIMGPLPSAIKLASFQGVPWTKALGLMSLSSFVLNEIFLLFIRGSPQNLPSIPTILNVSEIDWQGEEFRALRSQIEKNKDILGGVELLVGLVGGVLNLVFFVWAATGLWEYFATYVVKGEDDFARVLQWTVVILQLLVSLAVLSAIVIKFTEACCKPGLFGTPATVDKIVMYTLIALFFSILLPKKSSLDGGKLWRLVHSLDAVMYYGYAFFGTIYLGMKRLVRRYPGVGRGMMILKEQGDGREIGGDGWWSLVFFVVNLGTCVCWYLVLFEEEGTVNPKWTEVFGR